jgi:hypothetical protein
MQQKSLKTLHAIGFSGHGPQMSNSAMGRIGPVGQIGPPSTLHPRDGVRIGEEERYDRQPGKLARHFLGRDSVLSEG